MQRGQIYKHRGNWRLRYWDSQIVNGEIKKVRRSAHLTPIGNEYPTKRSVTHLADRILVPLNAHQVQPESSLAVSFFIENHYLPFVKRELRPSTYKDYKDDICEKHIKVRLGDLRLRDFRTVHGQRILRDIPGVGHTTLLRIKSFLSGVFKHAKREGFLDGENPMRDVSAPGKVKKFKGEVYTMHEIERIAEAVAKVDMKAFAAISVAAFAGLRLSELRGLRWSDYDGESLTVTRSVWRTHVGETKTSASAGSVPVLPLLKKVLDDHRVRVKGRDEEYIFAGERRGAPLNLANLARRVIIPSLKSTAADHEGPSVKWKGWHSFRRSLATNLYSCGVAPKVIQAILRHSDIGVTLQYYVETPDRESREALQKIEDWVRN
jgi:integrase